MTARREPERPASTTTNDNGDDEEDDDDTVPSAAALGYGSENDEDRGRPSETTSNQRKTGAQPPSSADLGYGVVVDEPPSIPIRSTLRQQRFRWDHSNHHNTNTSCDPPRAKRPCRRNSFVIPETSRAPGQRGGGFSWKAMEFIYGIPPPPTLAASSTALNLPTLPEE